MDLLKMKVRLQVWYQSRTMYLMRQHAVMPNQHSTAPPLCVLLIVCRKTNQATKITNLASMFFFFFSPGEACWLLQAISHHFQCQLLRCCVNKCSATSQNELSNFTHNGRRQKRLIPKAYIRYLWQNRPCKEPGRVLNSAPRSAVKGGYRNKPDLAATAS